MFVGYSSRRVCAPRKRADPAATTSAVQNIPMESPEDATLDELKAHIEELEEAAQLKDELIQNISHELRNPLTFIRGYVELLAEGELGPLTEEQRRSLAVISNKTDTLLRLVTEITSLNRLTPDMLQRSPEDVRGLVEAGVRGVEASASLRDLTLLLETPDTPQMALVDAPRLSQVIDNLLSNALKFSDEGGTIVARVLDLGARVRIEVEDDGLGIPVEAQPRIFERFYQGESGGRSRLGSGLGLAISKEIVEAHGGAVGVVSAQGEGSTFYVELDKDGG